MTELTGRRLKKFQTWRRENRDLKPITMEGNLDALVGPVRRPGAG